MFLNFLPHYFTFHLRRQMKELYLATGIADLAVAAILIFEPIYFYESLGWTPVEILLFFALVYFWYTLLIPWGAKFASRFGYKHAIVVSTPFQLIYWAILVFTTHNLILLWGLAPLFYALGKSFYWPAFHATIAKFAAGGQVGREFGMMSAIIQGAHILGPLAGGFLASRFGASSLFIVSGIVYSLSMIPLLMHKESGERHGFSFRDLWVFYKTQTSKMFAYFGFGEELLALSIWPIFMYVALQGYGAVGVVATVASGLSIVIGLWIGKLSDGKDKLKILRDGGFLSMLGWFARPFLSFPSGVLVSDTFGRTAKNAVFVPLCAVTYERSEASQKILTYMVFFEQSLALGKLLTALVCAGLFALTGSFSVLFIAGGLLSLLYMRL